MRTKAQLRGDEIRRLKRELACYRTFHNNVKGWFAARPERDREFSLFMLVKWADTNVPHPNPK